MLITRKSQATDTMHTMDLPVTQVQLDRWQAGELIQHVMPHLSVDQREFLITGTTKEEWDVLFGGMDDDEE